MTTIAIGAVGAVVALLLKALWDVPGAVRQHDRRVQELDQDLETWVVDDDARHKLALRSVDNDHAARNTFHSGLRLADRDAVRRETLVRFRNEARRVEREAAELYNDEGVLHRLWRRLRSRPASKLQAPARVERVLEQWRRDDSGNPVGGDPTTTKLDDLLPPSPSA